MNTQTSESVERGRMSAIETTQTSKFEVWVLLEELLAIYLPSLSSHSLRSHTRMPRCRDEKAQGNTRQGKEGKKSAKLVLCRFTMHLLYLQYLQRPPAYLSQFPDINVAAPILIEGEKGISAPIYLLLRKDHAYTAHGVLVPRTRPGFSRRKAEQIKPVGRFPKRHPGPELPKNIPKDDK